MAQEKLAIEANLRFIFRKDILESNRMRLRNDTLDINIVQIAKMTKQRIELTLKHQELFFGQVKSCEPCHMLDFVHGDRHERYYNSGGVESD